MPKSTGINNVLKGRAKTSAGFKWQYKEDTTDEKMPNTETYKDIYIYGKLSNYKIFPEGIVVNKNKIIKSSNDGYLIVSLSIGGEVNRSQVIRLVAHCFLVPQPELNLVVHLTDETNLNNST